MVWLQTDKERIWSLSYCHGILHDKLTLYATKESKKQKARVLRDCEYEIKTIVGILKKKKSEIKEECWGILAENILWSGERSLKESSSDKDRVKHMWLCYDGLSLLLLEYYRQQNGLPVVGV